MSAAIETTHTWTSEGDGGWGHWEVQHVAANGDRVWAGAAFLEKDKDSITTLRCRDLLAAEIRSIVERHGEAGNWPSGSYWVNADFQEPGQ